MDSDPLVKRMFFDMGRKMSRKAKRHVEEACLQRGLPVNTWYRWWLEARPTYSTYDNIVCSERTDAQFDEWVRGETSYAPARIAAQLDCLTIQLKDAVLEPGRELSRPIRGVGPLVQFTMGRYLDHPQDVEWLREAAVDELSAKPWLGDVLSKYSRYLPETGVVSNEKNTGSETCHQETKRTIW